jgi:hypothetical protein
MKLKGGEKWSEELFLVAQHWLKYGINTDIRGKTAKIGKFRDSESKSGSLLFSEFQILIVTKVFYGKNFHKIVNYLSTGTYVFHSSSRRSFNLYKGNLQLFKTLIF